MASTTTNSLLRASRPLFSSATASAAAQTRRTLLTRAGPFRSSAFGRQQWAGGRRWQSSTAEGAAAPGWFQRMWDSPIGFKTVHFWAPVMKWALVIAGIADFARPAEKLSLQQNGALTATGLIWTRWCLIITPKNYLLAAVNFFLGAVGVVQCTRILMYRSSLKNETALDKVKDKVASA